MLRFRDLPLFVGLALVAGCSLINKPDDVRPGPSTGGSGGSVPAATSSGEIGCMGDPDCASLDAACKKGVCDLSNHVCSAQNLAADTPCGDATASDCNAPDTCDADGNCQVHAAPDGTFCGDCAAGAGSCSLCTAGACNDCTDRATFKTFRNNFSAAGWTFTGGWGVYEQTPPAVSGAAPAIVAFPYPVLGTDGNRVRPYPGSEIEQSAALSPPTLIPAQLTFTSWSYDEGSHYDQKTIAVSVDNGASFTTVASCVDFTTYPFCHEIDGSGTDTWTPITIDLSPYPDLVGHVGLVRFSYNNIDTCCGEEKGWYIDQLNFATDCACTGNQDCTVFDGTCASGACDTNHECTLTPKTIGASCGDVTDATCSAPDTCDVHGFCATNDLERDGTDCESCADGAGNCTICVAGICNNCPDLQTFDGAFDTSNWQFTGGWNLYSAPPPLSNGAYLPFGTHGYVLGVDGVKVSPYWFENPVGSGFYSQQPTMREMSTFKTPIIPVPAQLTFDSWNQDRGGMSGRDTKRIRVSVDGGTTWTVLVDCQGANNTLPFCTQVMSRPLDAWDTISIDTGAAAGMPGMFEFSYDSLDAGNGFELGWYIDNINIMRCGGN